MINEGTVWTPPLAEGGSNLSTISHQDYNTLAQASQLIFPLPIGILHLNWRFYFDFHPSSHEMIHCT